MSCKKMETKKMTSYCVLKSKTKLFGLIKQIGKEEMKTNGPGIVDTLGIKRKCRLVRNSID